MQAGLFWTVTTVCVVAACAAQPPAPSAQKTAAAKNSTATRPAPVSKASASKSGQKTPAKAPSKTSLASARKSTTKTAPTPVHTAARPRQLQPTADRYHDIQNALVTKGYLQPEQATGAWDQNSIDALKRFQADQKLDATGKINSVSLINLGLGPTHDSDAALGNSDQH